MIQQMKIMIIYGNLTLYWTVPNESWMVNILMYKDNWDRKTTWIFNTLFIYVYFRSLQDHYWLFFKLEVLRLTCDTSKSVFLRLKLLKMFNSCKPFLQTLRLQTLYVLRHVWVTYQTPCLSCLELYDAVLV